MSPPQINRARQLCYSCPVRRFCLADGLEEVWGIWGGYTKPERARARLLLGTILEDPDGEILIVPAPGSAVLAAYDAGTLDALAVLR